MAKKKYYAVKYQDNSGVIFSNFEDYLKGIKGFSGSKSKGFRELGDAKRWLGSRSYQVVENNGQESTSKIVEKKKKTIYYAVARGRQIGVLKNRQAFLNSINGYKKYKGKGGFKTEQEAFEWLSKQGVSTKNVKGIYAVAKGYKTGVFSNLYTFEKNMYGYPNALGKGGFKTKQEAREWLNQHREKNVKKYYAVARGKRKGIYTSEYIYQKNLSGIKNSLGKSGFKNKEEARIWLESITKNKEYFAVAIGKRCGIYTDRQKFENSLKGVKNSWGKDGFKSREEAEKWLSERKLFLKKNNDILYKDTIIAYESRRLAVVYTDGSFHRDAKRYSSSVVICDSSGSVFSFTKAKNGKEDNIVAEVEALLYSLKLVISLFEFREFVLVYDFDGLDKIARNQMKIKGLDKEIQKEIHSMINKNELEIHFLNVKSHSGIIGNNIADKMAKDAVKTLSKLDNMEKISLII